MSELKAVLFDVDGTLAETERHGHLVAFNQSFDQFGLNWYWSPELYGELLAVTGSLERTCHYVKTHDAKYKHINPDLDSLLSNLIDFKNEAYLKIANSGCIPLRPGVERVLREIHDSDVRMAIVTTTSQQNIQSLLESTIGDDVMDWFEVIAAGNIVAHKKPAPDIYAVALEQLGLSANECLAIEDSENGVKSATAAGVPVMVVLSEYSKGHDLNGARLIIDEWGTEDRAMKVIEGDSDNFGMVSLKLMKHLVKERRAIRS